MQLAKSNQRVYFSLSGIRLISDLLCSVKGETKMFWDRVSGVYDLFGKVYNGKVIFYGLGNFCMEEVMNFKRDQELKGQDMRTSKSHREMTAISDAFKTTTRSFPMDSYLTMVAKAIIKDKKIVGVSYLPAYLPVGS